MDLIWDYNQGSGAYDPLEGDVVKTLQSIKKGIDLLDSRRTDLRAGEEDGIGPEDGLDDEALEDVPDDEGQPQPVRR